MVLSLIKNKLLFGYLLVALVMTGCNLPGGQSTSSSFSRSIASPSTSQSSNSSGSNPIPASPKPSSSASPSATAPVINAFAINPSGYVAGSPNTLSWVTTHASSISIDQGVGKVASSGQTSVNPTGPITYTLTATNSAGVSVTQGVTLAPTPVINSFTSSASSITQGSQATLSWNISGASYAQILGIGANATAVVAVGTFPVTPTQTTTYTLSVLNAAGATITKTLTVTVTAAPAVINSFKAQASSVVKGQSTQLSWSTTGAVSASIDNGIGSVPIGTQTLSVSPTQTTTYTLTATNSAGISVTQAAPTITVTQPVPTSSPSPTPSPVSSPSPSPSPLPSPSLSPVADVIFNSFTASVTTGVAGYQSILSWNISNATSVQFAIGAGALTSVPAVSTYTVTPLQTTVYTLSATNSAGKLLTKSLTLTATPPPPTINQFIVSPSTIIQDVPTTLSWIVNNATTVSIDQGVGTVPTYGQINVTPKATTTYTLTATNASGLSVTQTGTVTLPAVPPPVINSFQSNQPSIAVGSSAYLSYSVSNAETISISGVGNESASSNNIQVSPTQTTNYVLTATNSAGVSVSANCTVSVVPPAAITSFTFSPAAPNYGDLVTVSWATSNATSTYFAGIPGATTTTYPASGSATFTDTSYGGVVLSLQAVNTNNSITALQNLFVPGVTVKQLPAQQAYFVTQPYGTTAGTNLSFAVGGLDQNNNPTPLPTGSTCSVAVQYNSSAGLIGGSYSNIASTSGQANFNQVSFQKSGTYSLQATCTGVSNPSAASTQFIIAAGPSTTLSVTQQPPATLSVGAPFSTNVNLADTYGNPISNAITYVNAQPASLGGTLGVTTDSSGNAAFSNLSFTTGGGGYYTLSFTAGTLTTLSNGISVSSSAGSSPSPTPSPTTTYTANLSAPISMLYTYTWNAGNSFPYLVSPDLTGNFQSTIAVQVNNLTTGTIATELTTYFSSTASTSVSVALSNSSTQYPLGIGEVILKNGVGTIQFDPSYTAVPAGNYQLQITLLINPPGATNSSTQINDLLLSTPVAVIQPPTGLTGVLNAPTGRVSGTVSLSASSFTNLSSSDAIASVIYSFLNYGTNASPSPVVVGTSNDASSGYAFSLNTQNYADGFYTIVMSVVDIYGNTFSNVSPGSNIAIDNTPQTITQLVGGSGGNPYTDLAPAGSSIYGFNIKYGEVMDNLQAIWITSGGSPSQSTDPATHGGSGGTASATLTCGNPNYVVTGIQFYTCVNDGSQLDGSEFSIGCSEAAFGSLGTFTPTAAVTPTQANGTTGCFSISAAHTLQCPPSQVVVGIQGASGSENDAISLICK